MRREDLFTVVLEHFQNDTADHADILLPATTFLEHTDLYRAYGHHYLQMARPAVAAPGETRSNVDIFRALAERMGFGDQCFKGFGRRDDRDAAGIRGHPFLKGITLERLDREGSVRLNVSAEGEPFLGRSRKAASERLRESASWERNRSITCRRWNRVSAMRGCGGNILWS